MHQIGKNVRFTESDRTATLIKLGPKLTNSTSIIFVKLGVIFGEGYFILNYISHSTLILENQNMTREN